MPLSSRTDARAGKPKSRSPRRATTRALVRYTALASPVGRLYIAATKHGLSNLGMGRTERAFGREVEHQHGAAPVRDDAGLAPLRDELRRFLRGERRRLSVPLDLVRLTDFQRRVLQATARIPAGTLVSYGDIARRVGQPGAARAVGQALGANPIPIVIPCHRVVASAGIGGFTGGLHLKRALLALEGWPVHRPLSPGVRAGRARAAASNAPRARRSSAPGAPVPAGRRRASRSR
jgi:methylated-DNA-[protein]-cysteine S-methyltransferase